MSTPIARTSPTPTMNPAPRVPAAPEQAPPAPTESVSPAPRAPSTADPAPRDSDPVRSGSRAATPAPAGKPSAQPGWGSSRQMNGFETMMWRTDSIIPCPVMAIEQLDTVPEWDRFWAVHQRAVRLLPRLRQRVVEAPLGLGAPQWSEDPDFELGSHLWRTRMCQGHGWAQLLDRAARWARDPFVPARPLWEAVLCEGLPEGRSAYVIKMHHCLADGLGAAQLLEQLHSPTPEPTPADPQEPSVPAARSSALGTLVGQLRRDLTTTAHMITAAGESAWDATLDPAGAVSRASRYGQSLYRTLSHPDAPASPLLAGRGQRWRFAAIDVPLRELRAAAKVARATLNDAYLAALLGGYRRYHSALGADITAIPMAVPISLRRPGDPGGGNHIAGARFSGPTALTDPRERIQAIRKLILNARREPAIDTIAVISPLLARLPGALIAPLVAPATAGNDLQAGLLPGPRSPRYLAGAAVERVYPYAPLPGGPAMITMVTHGDIGCVGVNFDPAAFTQPELFLRCLLDGFTEVLALQPDPAEPLRRT